MSGVFDNIQKVAGTPYHQIEFNKDILDQVILRRAREKGIRLPTGTPPDVWNYHGAFVFTPTAGINRNVVYLDLASLYPNLMRACNVGPDTLIGTRDKLDESQYTEDDCVWSYVDPRPVKHVDKGENWRQYTDGTYKMIYDPNQNKTRWKDDPQFEKCFYVHPSIHESFMRELVDELIQMKYQYDGGLYEAIKRITNSVYGFSAYLTEYNSSRVADWRIGESITLGGRKVIQETSQVGIDVMEGELEGDVYISHGDSVPAEEPVMIRDGGDIDVVPIEQLLERGSVEVWSDDGFTEVQKVIQKPNRKQMYVVRTKHGVTHVTEDHSLVLDDGTEVKPENVEEGDELLHRDLADVQLPDDGETFGKERAWLYGFFVADGTCRHYEYDHRTDKHPWAISKVDRGLLKKAQRILDEQWDVSTAINDTMESSGCYKLQTSGCKNGQRRDLVEEFREYCYIGDEKRVPKEILNGSQTEREAFLEGYVAGDGNEQETSVAGAVEFSTRSEPLMVGLMTLFREQGWEYTVDRRVNHGGKEYYRVRTVSFHRGSGTEVTSIEKCEYDGEHVYDLQTGNGHFHAGVGSIIVHNTDGVGLACDTVASRDIMMDAAWEAADYLNDEGYAQFMSETFNTDVDAHFMEVEVESFAPSVFVPQDFGADDPNKGVKKRYAQWITIDDGEEEDEIEVKGFEAKRSDVAPITREAQKQVFEWILREDREAAWKLIAPYLRDLHEQISSGEMDVDRIAKRGGIGQSLSEYGSASRSPSPIYRGAKFADKHIDGEDLSEGSKPMCVYIDRVGPSLPSTYDTDTAEDGTVVDAISIEDVTNLPDDVQVDLDKHVEKSIVGPLKPILRTLGKDFDDVLLDHEQSGLGQFAV